MLRVSYALNYNIDEMLINSTTYEMMIPVL